jgi:hypothetical protein
VRLKAVARNFKDGEKINVKLTLLDENKKELGKKEDTTEVSNYKVKYPFVTEDLAKELGVEAAQVFYVKGWIDADGDGKVDHTMGYEEEVEFKIENERIRSLYFSYHEEPQKPLIHEVKEGGNLSLIAKQYGTTYQKIVSLNKIKNPDRIYPEQELIIPQNKQIKTEPQKLNSEFIPYGSKIDIVVEGTKNTEVTIDVLVEDKPIKVLKDKKELTQIKATLDDKGKAVIPVELRPKNDEDFKQIIDKLMPQVENTIKVEIKKANYEQSLETDDMNTIGLNYYQMYIKKSYVIDPNNGQVQSVLTPKQQDNQIVFYDEENQPVASTSMDNITNMFGNVNNGFGGLATGMEHIDGTFRLHDSKGVSLKHYESGWRGNQYVKTFSMSGLGNKISNGNLIVSILIGYVQIKGAYEKDSLELNKNGIDGIGQHTEKQAGSTGLGFAGGALTSRLLYLGILALPFELPVLAVLGTSIVIGGMVGWALSESGSAGVEFIQEKKRSTILNDYRLH